MSETTTGEPKAETLDDPDLDAAHALIEDAFERGRMLTIFGRCEVEYEGRASSYLGPGDRLVICKPDGTLLVHTDEQRTPVNWQPPGCDHSAEVADGVLRLRSLRSTPEEEIDVRFEAIHQVSSLGVSDPSELELAGTEADLRERILDDPSLIEEGFEPIEVERATPVGSVDLYGRDAEGRVVVLELKRRRVGPKAAGQLDRYVVALRRTTDEPVRGILVAPSITDGCADLLAAEGLEHVSLEPRL